MTEKRFTIEPTSIRECIVDNTTGEQLDTFDYTERLCELLNEFDEYIKELKQEVELLREGLKAYDGNLPLYLTPKEIRDFNSDLFKFKIREQKFYKEHPRLCKIIIDGKELNNE